MQHDQPGEMLAGREQVAQFPRVRAGARAAMRVTNRYTMPPLTPRGRRPSDFFWNAQDQEAGAATSTHQPRQPLSPAEEDAWLNDVLPPSRPARPLDDTGKGAGASAEARTDGEAWMTGEARAGASIRADGEASVTGKSRATGESTRATPRVAPNITAPGS